MELGYLKHRINEILDNHYKLLNMVKTKIPEVVKSNLDNDIKSIKNILETAKRMEDKHDNQKNSS